MEIREKNLDAISNITNNIVKKHEAKATKENLQEEDTVSIKKIEIETQESNSKKVSDLKNKYEAGTLKYNSTDVAKAFLKEAIGIY